MNWMVVRGVTKLVARLIPVDDVGGLRVQLPNIFMVKPLREPFHLGKLATRLQHDQDTH